MEGKRRPRAKGARPPLSFEAIWKGHGGGGSPARRPRSFVLLATACSDPFGTGVHDPRELPELAARRPFQAPPEQGSFTDPLDAYDTSRWLEADGWKNGSPFDNAWRADHVTFGGGRMTLRLDDRATLGEPYTSGHHQTTGYYGYGCYAASFRPVASAGVVTSFFTFAGP